MTKEKEVSIRRVYVLPAELVARIVEFQEDKNYPSEVEAVRKLLDEALLHRDTPATIISRFKSRLEKLRMPAEVAKDVLVGHPLVSNISFGKDEIAFELTDGNSYRISEKGDVSFKSMYGREPWKNWPPLSGDMGDDIPF